MRITLLLSVLLLAAPTSGQTPTEVKIKPGAVLQEKGPPISSAGFSQDGKLLATGGMDKTIQVWDITNRRKVLTLKGHQAPVTGIVFTPDGKHLISSSIDKTVKIWNLSNGMEAAQFAGFKLAVLCLAVSPDGTTLAAGTGYQDRVNVTEIKLFDLPQRKELASLNVSGRINKAPEVMTIQFAPDGKTFAAALKGEAIQRWDPATKEKVSSFYGLGGFANAACYTPDGFTVAAAYNMGTIFLVDARTWKQLSSLKVQRDVRALSFAGDGRTLAAASYDGTVKLWDIATKGGSALATVRSGKGPASVALFAADGKTLAVGGFDGHLALVDVTRTSASKVVQNKNDPKTPGDKTPRLALVSTERAAGVQALLDLAAAKISGDVQLLERRDIDAVLAEQKLTLSGFVKADQVLQLGKLLGVDLFAVVETDRRNQQAVGLVIFNAKTGVRFWDATLPAEGLDQTVDAVAQAVRRAVFKQATQNKHLPTICLTTVRNADLPRSQDPLCDLVGHLLERGLVSSPDLTLLERTRLEQIAQERNLPTDSLLAQVLTSLVRMELEVSKAPDGKGLRGTVFLADNRGKDLGKVTAVVADADPTALAQALVKEVAQPLQVRPGEAVLDRAREVFRLSAEAAFFEEHRDWSHALKARQAASVLRPDDQLLRAQLAAVLMEAGRAVHRLRSNFVVRFFSPPTSEQLRASLELMLRGVDALLEVEAAGVVPPADRYTHAAWHNLVTYLDAVNRLQVDPETRTLLEKLQERNAALQDLRQEMAFRQVNDRGSYQFYTARLGDPVHALYFDDSAGLTTEQLRRHQTKLLMRWLELAEKWGAPPLPAATAQGTFHLLRGLATLGAADRAQNYRQALVKTQDPLIVLLDRQADFLLQVHKLEGVAKQQSIRELRAFVEKFLTAKQTQASSLVRYHGYLAALQAIHFLETTKGFEQTCGQELKGIYQFMLQRREVVPEVIQQTLQAGRGSKSSRAAEAERFTLLKQALALVDDARFLTDETFLATPETIAIRRKDLKESLLTERQRIIAQYPDLERALVQPWPRVEKLLDVVGTSHGIVRLLHPKVHAGHLYVTGIGQQKTTPRGRLEGFLQLLRLPVQGGGKEELGKLPLEFGHPTSGTPAYLLSFEWKFAVGASIHANRYLLGTKDHGIVIFALDGKEVTHLHTGTGLPSAHVQELACLDGKVYAGLGQPGKEAYLVAHDLQTGKTEVLASSRRKEKLSPLDDLTPFRVLALRPDPERQRLLAYLWVGSIGETRKRNGLWEISRTGQLRQLQHLSVAGVSTPLDLEWASPVVDDRLLLALHDATYLVDLKSDQLHKAPVAVPSTNRVHHYLEPRLAHLVQFLKPGERTIPLRKGDFFHGGWLYTPHPFGRVSLDGTRKEAFPNLRDKYIPTFQPWEAFQVVGDQFLIADQHALWVAPVPKGK